MSLIPAGMLSQCRQIWRSSFPDTVQVLRNTAVDDDSGGQTDNWAVVHTYPCRVLPLPAGQETIEGAATVSVSLYAIKVPHDSDINAVDRLVVAGVTYEVVQGDDGRSEAICQTWTCKQRT